jgi:hypothetical protein
MGSACVCGASNGQKDKSTQKVLPVELHRATKPAEQKSPDPTKKDQPQDTVQNNSKVISSSQKNKQLEIINEEMGVSF